MASGSMIVCDRFIDRSDELVMYQGAMIIRRAQGAEQKRFFRRRLLPQMKLPIRLNGISPNPCHQIVEEMSRNAHFYFN